MGARSLVLVLLAASTAIAGPSRPLKTSFVALDDDDLSIPPNPSGAVGPANLVAIAGTQLRIQTKTGALVATHPVAELFASLAHTTHDPARVIFDPRASRWVIVAAANSGTAIDLAVSQTTDPAGAYDAFTLPIDAPLAATGVRVGSSDELIVVTAVMTDRTSHVAQGPRVYACTKQELPLGAAACRARDFSAGQGATELEPAVAYEASFGTAYLVERDTSAPYVQLVQLIGSAGNEQYLTRGVDLGVTNWARLGAQTNLGFAPQAGTLNRIDTGDDRIASVAVRHGHIFAAHTIYLPAANPTRTAVQWFELDPTAVRVVVQVGRIDDATAGFDYAYPAIAVSSSEDIFLTFAKFGTTISPTLAYASRMHGDPLNELSIDVTVRAGAGTYAKTHGGTVNLWGGGGGASVDPADDRTMWAIGAVAAAPDPSPCVTDCGNWSTSWAALATDCAGVADGVACDADACHAGTQTCAGGTCVGGTIITCVADECFTAGTCAPNTGCVQQLAPDGSPCTEGVCSFGTCQHFADDFPPLDGDALAGDAPFHEVGNHGGSCGCKAGGSASGGAVLAIGVLFGLRRRRIMR